MPAYLTLAEFRLNTLLPDVVVDEIEARTPGWTDQQALLVSEHIDSRLRKRYRAPFATPYPAVLKEWVTHIVSLRAYLKRGVSSLDEQFGEYKAQHDRALGEVQEAADSDGGLFDLPLRADTTATGIEQGFPRAYSEQSPYAWTDEQAAVGRAEDDAGTGTLR